MRATICRQISVLHGYKWPINWPRTRTTDSLDDAVLAKKSTLPDKSQALRLAADLHLALQDEVHLGANLAFCVANLYARNNM